MKYVNAWHFVSDDRRLQYDATDLTVEPGYIYEYDGKGPIKMCESGMHASRRVYDALQHAPGSVLCRVRMSGGIIEGVDKLVATKRHVLDVRNVSRELRLWGCWCVRNTKLADGRVVWDLLVDERSRNAVVIAERHARGDAKDIELAAAGAAAGAAAWDAARAAAWAAAGAAAWDAAGKQQGDELERRMRELFGVRA